MQYPPYIIRVSRKVIFSIFRSPDPFHILPVARPHSSSFFSRSRNRSRATYQQRVVFMHLSLSVQESFHQGPVQGPLPLPPVNGSLLGFSASPWNE
jgi:hypothetical protein